MSLSASPALFSVVAKTPTSAATEARVALANTAPHLFPEDAPFSPTHAGGFSENSSLVPLPQEGALPATTLNFIVGSPFTPAFDNYYLTDVITQSSITMGKCATRFADKYQNYPFFS